MIFGSMASEIMNEMLTEDKLVQMWPDFPFLYDVQSPAFKNRDLCQQAMETIAEQVNQNGPYFVVGLHSAAYRRVPLPGTGMFTMCIPAEYPA